MSAGDYADYLFFSWLAGPELSSAMASGWVLEEDIKELFRQQIRSTFVEYGYNVGNTFDALADENFQYLLERNAFMKEGDKYTGVYVALRESAKNDAVRNFIQGHEVTNRVNALGDTALYRALSRLADEHGWSKSESYSSDPVDPGAYVDTAFGNMAPAADRIVRLDDNQVKELDAAAKAVVDILVTENSIDGDIDLKDRFLGQIRATQELVRGHSVRAYLVYEAAVRVLGTLIERYKDQALAEAAKRLLDLLFERIFKN